MITLVIMLVVLFIVYMGSKGKRQPKWPDDIL
jgi:hypothetical protein